MLEICKKREKTLELALEAHMSEVAWTRAQEVAVGSGALDGARDLVIDGSVVLARLSIYKNMRGKKWEDDPSAVVEYLKNVPDGDAAGGGATQKEEATLMWRLLTDPALEADVTEKLKAIPTECKKFLE